jgi:hypothetical protein
MEKTFALEQGITSPRDGSVNWQTYEVYETLAGAKREARKNKGLWRIIEARVVWQSPVTT